MTQMAQHDAVGMPWHRGRVEIDAACVDALDAYWRCANYLSVGQIYLRSNPLLRRPLEFSDV